MRRCVFIKNLVVFFGGASVEHDISVITGVLTLNSIDKEKYNPVPIYVDNDGTFYTSEILFDVENYKSLDYKLLKKCVLIPGSKTLYILKRKKLVSFIDIAVAINCMHGERGEDGSIVGLLNLCDIPLASPKILGSSVAMDKIATKTFLKGLNINYIPCVNVKCEEDLFTAEKIGYPLIVKPACSGSSIGIEKVNNLNELKNAVSNAFRFGDKVLVEKYIEEFTEINCAVYKNSLGEIVCSPLEQPVTDSSILTFNDKYSSGNKVFPAKLPSIIKNKIIKICKKIYDGLFFNGIIRIDFLLEYNKIYVNEINSVPGSLSYYLFCETLDEFRDLLSDLISCAEKEFTKSQTVKRNIKTNLLQITGIKGAKRLQ